MEQSRQEAGQRAMDSLQGLAAGPQLSERPPMANSSASNNMVGCMVILCTAACQCLPGI